MKVSMTTPLIGRYLPMSQLKVVMPRSGTGPLQKFPMYPSSSAPGTWKGCTCGFRWWWWSCESRQPSPPALPGSGYSSLCAYSTKWTTIIPSLSALTRHARLVHGHRGNGRRFHQVGCVDLSGANTCVLPYAQYRFWHHLVIHVPRWRAAETSHATHPESDVAAVRDWSRKSTHWFHHRFAYVLAMVEVVLVRFAVRPASWLYCAVRPEPGVRSGLWKTNHHLHLLDPYEPDQFERAMLPTADAHHASNYEVQICSKRFFSE